MHTYMLCISPRTSLCLALFPSLSPTNSHTRRPVVWFLCALVWRCCHCYPVSEASRTSPRACRRKLVIWSIFSPKTFMCHCFTHKPLMFGENHYPVRLYFLSISFMNEIGNCQRGVITPCVFSIRQSFGHISGLSENTPPESLLIWDYCQPTVWWLWQSSITCHYIREWPSHCVHFLFSCFLLYLRGQADEPGWPAQSQICLCTHGVGPLIGRILVVQLLPCLIWRRRSLARCTALAIFNSCVAVKVILKACFCKLFFYLYIWGS